MPTIRARGETFRYLGWLLRWDNFPPHLISSVNARVVEQQSASRTDIVDSRLQPLNGSYNEFRGHLCLQQAIIEATHKGIL